MLAGPLLARSQSHLSQSSVSQYVEDSEPEREERRTKEKSRRKEKRAEVNIPSAEVIELTSDSDVSYNAGRLHPISPKLQGGPVTVIDISDSSDAALPRTAARASLEPRENSALQNNQVFVPDIEDATTDDSLPFIRDMFDFPQRAPKVTPSADADSRRPPKSQAREKPPFIQVARPLSLSKPADGPEDDEDGSLRLGRFAYAAPIRRTASKTPSPIEGVSVPPDARVAAKAKRTASHRFVDDLSDAQLARVLKCVSCDLAWTTRKTVAQKMKHIQTCAKKNGLSDETVRTLLRKELDSLPPVASASSSKSATLAPAPEPAEPETLLEDLLKDTHKKKPGRRPQVLQTVKSVTDTRVTILDRARSLLQSEGLSRAGSCIPQSSGNTPSPADLELPPATQLFSRSSVAARDDLPHHFAADTTQVFGPSRLAGPSRLQGAIVRAGVEIAAQSDVSPLTQVLTTDVDGAVLGDNDPEQPPPSTQIFAQSKLTNVRGITRRIVLAPNALDDPISIHDTSEDDFTRRSSPTKPSDARAPRSPSANASSPPRSRKTRSPRNGAAARRTPSLCPRRSPAPSGDGWGGLTGPASRVQAQPHLDALPDDHNDYDSPWNEWIRDIWNEDDGACLHYVPEPHAAGGGVAGPLGTHARDKPLSPPLSPLRRRLATILEDAPGPFTDVGAEPPEPVKKKRGRRKKAAAEASDAEGAEGKVADVSQDELNAKMKAAILEDAALHLRILRYEPIHFDVFLQMAVALGMPAKRSGLKGKVRAFLDQKAIHFYGADPSKSRTKRTRHP